MKKINLAELIFPTPEKVGNREGQCVWCGRKSTQGLPLRVSDGFTGYSYFGAGNCMCPHCWAVFDEPLLRRRSWLAIKGRVRLLDREGVRETLLSPPTTAWYLYVARAGKKQGWLPAIHKVNYSRENYFLSCEWQLMPIWVSRPDIIHWLALIGSLREVKVPKGELLSGQFGAKTYERAINGGYRELLSEARVHARKPIWGVLVYVSD